MKKSIPCSDKHKDRELYYGGTVNYSDIREKLLKSGLISSGRESTAGARDVSGFKETDERTVCDGKRNIILIGMPGCGKSTIGRKLSRDFGFTFVDADTEFSKKYGIAAADCIKEMGEAEFRRRESEVLKGFQADKRLCIATGGGVVTVPENREILKKLGLIVYLKRDLGKLSVKGRPLSAGKGVEKLFEERKENYVSWSDITVENNIISETVRSVMHHYRRET